MKKCSVCQEEKSLSEFYTFFSKKDQRSYYQSYCKTCKAAKHKDWVEKNRAHVNEYARKRGIKTRYGIDAATYEQMIRDGCEVCGSHEGLAVDHDHACCPDGRKTCGQCVRGILCRRHNWAVANLKDSADEARALAKYLEKSLELVAS